MKEAILKIFQIKFILLFISNKIWKPALVNDPIYCHMKKYQLDQTMLSFKEF